MDFQVKDFFQFFLFQLAEQKLQGIAIALADFVELNANPQIERRVLHLPFQAHRIVGDVQH